MAPTVVPLVNEIKVVANANNAKLQYRFQANIPAITTPNTTAKPSYSGAILVSLKSNRLNPRIKSRPNDSNTAKLTCLPHACCAAKN